MTRTVEAVFSGGVFRPTESVQLPDQQKVTLYYQTAEPISFPSDSQRRAALERLWKKVDEMNIRIMGPYPSRDELHERR